MPQSDSQLQHEPESLPPDTARAPSSPELRTECGRRLNSWKEIGAYLGRAPRTAQSWEKLKHLPVHRQVNSDGGWESVYAFTSEIDAWQQSQRKAAGFSENSSTTAGSPPGEVVRLRSR